MTRNRAVLLAVAVVMTSLLAGCGTTTRTVVKAAKHVPACSGVSGLNACVADIARLRQRLAGLPSAGIKAKCSQTGAWWTCSLSILDEEGNPVCLKVGVRTTPRAHVPVLLAWGTDYENLCGVT